MEEAGPSEVMRQARDAASERLGHTLKKICIELISEQAIAAYGTYDKLINLRLRGCLVVSQFLAKSFAAYLSL